MIQLLFREIFYLLENYPKLYLKKWCISGDSIEVVIATKSKTTEAYHVGAVVLGKSDTANQIRLTIQDIEFALLGKEDTK